MPPKTFDIILVVMVRSTGLGAVPGSILIRLRLKFWPLSQFKGGSVGASEFSPPALGGAADGPFASIALDLQVGRLARCLAVLAAWGALTKVVPDVASLTAGLWSRDSRYCCCWRWFSWSDVRIWSCCLFKPSISCFVERVRAI